MQGGGYTLTTNNTSFDGRLCAFMDHSHDKGWGYDPSNVDRYGVQQQDGGAFIANGKGEAYWEYPGILYKTPCVTQTGATGTISSFVNTVTDTNPLSRTSGKVIFPVPDNSTRWICTIAQDNNHNQNVPVIFEANWKGNEYTGTPMCRTDVGWSRGAKFFVHPDYIAGGSGTNTVVAGKWFITNYNATLPQNINFTSYNDYEVLGWSKEGSTVNWLFGTAGNTGSIIYRSTNSNGSGPTSWKTLSDTALKTACGVNPFQHQLLYYSLENDDGLLRRVTASTNQIIVDFRPLIDAKFTASGISLDNIRKAWIEHVVPDLNVEGLVYVCFNAQGLGGVWRVRNAHSTNLADLIVEDITANSTYTNSTMLTVHPMTGEVRFHSSMGQYIMPAPSWYPSLTYKNRHSTFLTNFYGKNGIPTPRVVTPL
jgi:hypothetical protein